MCASLCVHVCIVHFSLWLWAEWSNRPQTWVGGGVLERGSDRGVGKREGGGVRAESAGSFANRRGSSVNGVNEEWEQTKCAEIREVPPHCIGRCSLCVSSTQSHRHKHNHAHTLAFFSFTCTRAIPLCLPHFQHLLTQNTFFLHLLAPLCTFSYFRTRPSTLPASHTNTYTLSSSVLFPCFFILCAAPSLAPPHSTGEEIRCDTTVFVPEVKRYSATPCRPLTQLIRLMGWQVPAETHTQPLLTCYRLSSTY